MQQNDLAYVGRTAGRHIKPNWRAFSSFRPTNDQGRNGVSFRNDPVAPLDGFGSWAWRPECVFGTTAPSHEHSRHRWSYTKAITETKLQPQRTKICLRAPTNEHRSGEKLRRPN